MPVANRHSTTGKDFVCHDLPELGTGWPREESKSRRLEFGTAELEFPAATGESCTCTSRRGLGAPCHPSSPYNGRLQNLVLPVSEEQGPEPERAPPLKLESVFGRRTSRLRGCASTETTAENERLNRRDRLQLQTLMTRKLLCTAMRGRMAWREYRELFHDSHREAYSKNTGALSKFNSQDRIANGQTAMSERRKVLNLIATQPASVQLGRLLEKIPALQRLRIRARPDSPDRPSPFRRPRFRK